MRTTSCGILVLTPGAELLLCHATGTAYWDIPKGRQEPGETALQTALRETEEETALAFRADELVELGPFAYRPEKNLHLFAALREPVPVAQLVCRTHFRDRAGRLLPEMDRFAWTPFGEVQRRCARRLGELLTSALSLPELLGRLQAERPFSS